MRLPARMNRECSAWISLIVCATIATAGATRQNYRQYVGQQHRFCGVVVDIAYGPFERQCEIALMLGAGAERWQLAALLPHSALPVLKAEKYRGHEICVTGMVTEEKKKPYIVVTDSAQIEDVREVLARDPARLEAPPVPPDVVRPCDEGATFPKMIKEVKPQYTSRAMQDRARGVVEVQVVVNQDGSVRDVALLKTLHRDLDAATVDAVRKSKFTPGTQFGKPIPTVVVIDFTFTLR